MRYSDIKVGNVYFVKLEPVKDYEFGGNHLGIVLRKGQDNRTVTIISLTSKSSGVGENKIDIGLIQSLPKRLIEDKNGNPLKSFVILDQIRTVNVIRIQEILDGKDSNGKDKAINCTVDSHVFSEINYQLSNFTINNLTNEDEIWMYYKNSYLNHSVKKMINLTYTVIKGKGNDTDKDQITYLYSNAIAIKSDFSIVDYLKPADVKNKVEETLLNIVSGPNKVII